MSVNVSGEFCIGICHFCEHHGPCALLNTRLIAKDGKEGAAEGRNRHQFPSSSNALCAACNPLGSDHPGFLSSVPDAKASTFSSSWCTSDRARSNLQQACFRSLSSEVSPSKEGALFFSDSGLGIHVISHTFFLKDSSARGFQRWFSLIALSTESASGLLQLWNTLVPEMKELIGELQQSAAEVYQREEVQCSHRMLRSTLPHPHVANVGAARSLQDMTGNPVVLLKLHSKLSRMVLLAHFAGQARLKQPLSRHCLQDPSLPPGEEESVLALVRICQEIGSDFKRYARHILKGGSTSVATDDLFFKESCISALQLLRPNPDSRSFLLPQHTLQSVSHPYLMISARDRKITCILNNCEPYNKVSCIAARLENILLADEVSPSFIHQQIRGVREELGAAAVRVRDLKGAEQARVLQFFQSFGYDSGDMEILHHWSLHC